MFLFRKSSRKSKMALCLSLLYLSGIITPSLVPHGNAAPPISTTPKAMRGLLARVLMTENPALRERILNRIIDPTFINQPGSRIYRNQFLNRLEIADSRPMRELEKALEDRFRLAESEFKKFKDENGIKKDKKPTDDGNSGSDNDDGWNDNPNDDHPNDPSQDSQQFEADLNNSINEFTEAELEWIRSDAAADIILGKSGTGGTTTDGVTSIDDLIAHVIETHGPFAPIRPPFQTVNTQISKGGTSSNQVSTQHPKETGWKRFKQIIQGLHGRMEARRKFWYNYFIARIKGANADYLASLRTANAANNIHNTTMKSYYKARAVAEILMDPNTEEALYAIFRSPEGIEAIQSYKNPRLSERSYGSTDAIFYPKTLVKRLKQIAGKLAQGEENAKKQEEVLSGAVESIQEYRYEGLPPLLFEVLEEILVNIQTAKRIGGSPDGTIGSFKITLARIENLNTEVERLRTTALPQARNSARALNKVEKIVEGSGIDKKLSELQSADDLRGYFARTEEKVLEAILRDTGTTSEGLTSKEEFIEAVMGLTTQQVEKVVHNIQKATKSEADALLASLRANLDQIEARRRDLAVMGVDFTEAIDVLRPYLNLQDGEIFLGSQVIRLNSWQLPDIFNPPAHLVNGPWVETYGNATEEVIVELIKREAGFRMRDFWDSLILGGSKRKYYKKLDEARKGILFEVNKKGEEVKILTGKKFDETAVGKELFDRLDSFTKIGVGSIEKKISEGGKLASIAGPPALVVVNALGDFMGQIRKAARDELNRDDYGPGKDDDSGGGYDDNDDWDNDDDWDDDYNDDWDDDYEDDWEE